MTRIRKLAPVAAAAVAFALAPQVARAEGPPPAGEAVAASGTVVIEAGGGRVFRIRGKISSLFVSDPKVVEVRPASPGTVFVFGVGPGRSTVAALDDSGNPVAQFDVVVQASSYAAGETAASLRRYVPGTQLRFSDTPAGMIIHGQVQTPAAAEQVESTAKNFIGDNQALFDRTTIDTSVQVTLRVRVAEISRTITRQFGINWTAMANFGRWGAAALIADTLSQSQNAPNTISGSYTSGANSINTILDLLAQDQLITMLAEPNLTARSGETASFLAGGEFPVPTSGSNGQISVTFKPYGVSLAFVPTVLSHGRISLHVHPEVSEISSVGAVTVPLATSLFGTSTVTIPAVTVRRADTTVELGSGQSFAIAGMLTADDSFNARGLPGLGELPVVGTLFKSDLFQRDKTELVIVVTPYIVRPAGSPNDLRAPTDDFVPANDGPRVLWNRQREWGTDPGAIIAPSAAAFTLLPGIGPANVPAGAGFMLH